MNSRRLGLMLTAAGLLALTAWVVRPLLEAAKNEADRQAIHQVIQSQLDALKADDADRVFELANPAIQARFGTPAHFMAMIKAEYEPIYRPRAVFFQDVLVRGDLALQRLLVVDSHGRAVAATYFLQRQQNGAWRIGGCRLAPGEGMVV